MKIRKNNNQSGGALLVTIVITGVLTLAMASYLSLVSGQFRQTMRSQEWNAAMPVTEAGVEDAMAHLNKNCLTNGLNATEYKPNKDGWSFISAVTIKKTGTLTDGSYYTAQIDLTDPVKPTIFSEGFTSAPLAGLMPTALYAAIGNNGETQAPKLLNRKVRVTTRIVPVFSHALAANDGIQMSGNNVGTDSFNSTNGAYNSNNRHDKGDVATNSDLDNALDIGNANIRGHISTGPGSEQPSIGSNGVVGDNEYVDGGGSGIQTNSWTDDMNVEFEDVVAPFASGMSPTSPYNKPGLLTTNYSTNVIATCACSGGNNCCIPGNPALGGTVTPVIKQESTPTYPALGSYVAPVQPNWTPDSSVSYPSGNVRDILPTSTPTTSAPYSPPASGTYVGTVTASIVAAAKTKTKPADGTYEAGSLVKQGSFYNYNVTVYNYQKLTGYTFERLTSYTYGQIKGYQRSVPVPTVVTNSVEVFTYGFNTPGNYKVSSLSGTIYIGANVVVYCTGAFTSSKLVIAPGASMKLYLGGDMTLSGNDKVNQGGLAKNLSLYGLPGCLNIKLSGNAEFTGTIYAPQAFLQIAGGGNDSKDFFGAVIVGSAKLNGHTKFHYDEDLVNSGPSRGYIANSWKEVGR